MTTPSSHQRPPALPGRPSSAPPAAPPAARSPGRPGPAASRPRRSLRAALLLTAALGLGVAVPPGPARAATDYLADGLGLFQRGDLRAALIQFRNAVRANPGSGQAHYMLGQVSLQLGDAVTAEREARAALDAGYDKPAATELLTRTYLAQDRARALLTDLPPDRSSPGLAAATLSGAALAQISLGQLDAAEASIAEAEKLAPKEAAPLLVEVRLALARGDAARAEKAVDRALAIDPHSAEGLLDKARLQARRNDSDGALRTLDGLIASDPGDYQARVERARLNAALRHDDEAGKDVAAVLAALPGNVPAIYLHALLLARSGKYKEADTEMGRISAYRAQLQGGFYLDALIKAELGDLEQARDSAEKYAARAPGDAEGAKLLARLDMQAKEPGRAVAALERAAAAGAKDPSIYAALGQAYLAAGRVADARASLEKASALDPNNAAVRNMLGAVELRSGDAAAASATLDKAPPPAGKQDANAAALRAGADLAAGKLDQAATEIAALPDLGVSAERVGLLQGGLGLARLDPAAARSGFEAALKENPKSTPGQLGLARAAVQEGKTDEARRLTEDVLAREPTNAEAISLDVALLQGSGHADQALAVLERAHAAAPKDQGIALVLAQAYLVAKKPDQALALLPSDDAAGQAAQAVRRIRGVALAEAGKTADARDAFRAALAVDPSDIATRVNLVHILLADNKTDEARDVAADGLRRAPESVPLMQATLEVAMKAGGPPAALAAARTLAADPAHGPIARTLPGDMQRQAGQNAAAAASYAAALKEAPSSLLAIRQAQALAAAGQPAQASAALDAWLKAHPDDLDVTRAAAILDISAGRFPVAADRLKRVLEKRPNDVEALNNLAWVQQQLGSPEARSLAERAYRLAPGAMTADTLGWILVKSNDPDGLRLLRLAAAQAPQQPEIAYHLAVALYEAGQKQEAVNVLSAAANNPQTFNGKADAQRLLATWTKQKG